MTDWPYWFLVICFAVGFGAGMVWNSANAIYWRRRYLQMRCHVIKMQNLLRSVLYSQRRIGGGLLIHELDQWTHLRDIEPDLVVAVDTPSEELDRKWGFDGERLER